MNSKENIVEEMQQIVEQMRLDDIEENPDSEFETFECDACGQAKPLAGSVEYEGGYRLCNDCVLIAETGFALNKITHAKEVVDAMEYKRLQTLCDIIKAEENKENN